MPDSSIKRILQAVARRGVPVGLAAVFCMAGAGGCRTTAPDAPRSEPYRPVTDGLDLGVAIIAGRPETPVRPQTPPTVPSVPRETPAPETAAAPPSPPASETRLRTMQVGDRLEIYLHGIPNPQKLPVVIDENGFVTMPLIGQVRASGKTGSELERLIERMYIEKQFYRNVTCVVIPPPIEFFMRGEVRQPGRFPLHRDVTLPQAIALAGGYTEYAQPRRIRIHRGTESFVVDSRRIERGEVPPSIEPGDIIVVPRRRW